MWLRDFIRADEDLLEPPQMKHSVIKQPCIQPGSIFS